MSRSQAFATAGGCPGGRHCTCPPAPVHGCCLLHFPDDPCDDCPAAHPEKEEFCEDCGIGELESELAYVPRHGGEVLLCRACYGDDRERRPEEYRDAS